MCLCAFASEIAHACTRGPREEPPCKAEKADKAESSKVGEPMADWDFVSRTASTIYEGRVVTTSLVSQEDAGKGAGSVVLAHFRVGAAEVIRKLGIVSRMLRR